MKKLLLILIYTQITLFVIGHVQAQQNRQYQCDFFIDDLDLQLMINEIVDTLDIKFKDVDYFYISDDLLDIYNISDDPFIQLFNTYCYFIPIYKYNLSKYKFSNPKAITHDQQINHQLGKKSYSIYFYTPITDLYSGLIKVYSLGAMGGEVGYSINQYLFRRKMEKMQMIQHETLVISSGIKLIPPEIEESHDEIEGHDKTNKKIKSIKTKTIPKQQ